MDVRCENFRVDEKGGLRGFCDLVIDPSGLGVRLLSCKLFRAGPREWIELPSRAYQSKGRMKVVPTIDFTTHAAYWDFQSAALEAIREFRSSQPQQQAEALRGAIQSGGHS